MATVLGKTKDGCDGQVYCPEIVFRPKTTLLVSNQKRNRLNFWGKKDYIGLQIIYNVQIILMIIISGYFVCLALLVMVKNHGLTKDISAYMIYALSFCHMIG